MAQVERVRQEFTLLREVTDLDAHLMSCLPPLWQSFSDAELDELEEEIRGTTHYPSRESDLDELNRERDSRRPRPSDWGTRPQLRSRGRD